MNPALKNNQRVTYLRELPPAVALDAYIQELDAKYNVNSKDPNNSFGHIKLDSPIIKLGIDDTLYSAKISTFGFFSETDLLPKYEQLPRANHVVSVNKNNKNGNVVLFENIKRLMAKRKPITIDEADLIKLRRLREAFQTEVETNAPKQPFVIKDDDLINPADFFEGNTDKPKTFGEFSANDRQSICEKIYTDAGFANSPDYELKIAIPVTYTKSGKPKDIFEVRYSRIGRNTTFDFATSYKGWQNQYEMPLDHPCYLFWEKWDVFHTKTLTINEWYEMRNDLYDIEKDTYGLDDTIPNTKKKLADCDIILTLDDNLEKVFGEDYFDDLIALILENLTPDPKHNRKLNAHENAYTTTKPITYRGKTFKPKLVIDTHEYIITRLDI